jgi:hypothetical protein
MHKASHDILSAIAQWMPSWLKVRNRVGGIHIDNRERLLIALKFFTSFIAFFAIFSTSAIVQTLTASEELKNVKCYEYESIIGCSLGTYFSLDGVFWLYLFLSLFFGFITACAHIGQRYRDAQALEEEQARLKSDNEIKNS